MKKSEILEVLKEESAINVDSYYRLGNTDILIVYCSEITWKTIKILGDDIINITASETNNYKIKVSFEKVIFD